MGFSDRQTKMLEEMGIRVWTRPEPALVPEPEPITALPAAMPPRALRPGAAPVPAPEPEPTSAPMVSRQAEVPVRMSPVPEASGSRPTGVETMDWPALRDAVASCTACRLCEGRTQAVFGVGHERAHWMIVGEAPGEQEDRQGEPFVGKSGQLLDNMLRAVGLTREAESPERQVYIANTLKCRPPFNRNPEPQELAQCEPFLVRQIAMVQPRVILAMGRFAVQSLLRSAEPIGRLRGRVHVYEGVPLVVTYHPAYLLRNPEDKGRAWDDLCLAREILEAAG